MEKQPQIYIATRDQLKVNEGSVHGGEAFPASEVTPPLLDLGWVTPGKGVVPADDRTHELFADGELAQHAPALPKAKPPKASKPAKVAAPKTAKAKATKKTPATK